MRWRSSSPRSTTPPDSRGRFARRFRSDRSRKCSDCSAKRSDRSRNAGKNIARAAAAVSAYMFMYPVTCQTRPSNAIRKRTGLRVAVTLYWKNSALPKTLPVAAQCAMNHAASGTLGTSRNSDCATPLRGTTQQRLPPALRRSSQRQISSQKKSATGARTAVSFAKAASENIAAASQRRSSR